MATIQIRVDDGMKWAADSLFTALGLDTSTAVRMFLAEPPEITWDMEISRRYD